MAFHWEASLHDPQQSRSLLARLKNGVPLGRADLWERAPWRKLGSNIETIVMVSRPCYKLSNIFFFYFPLIRVIKCKCYFLKLFFISENIMLKCA